MKSAKNVMTIECTYKFMYICTVCVKMCEFSESFKCQENCGTSSFSETRLFYCPRMFTVQLSLIFYINEELLIY